MSEQRIDPGEGWRELSHLESISPGDVFKMAGSSWAFVEESVGMTVAEASHHFGLDMRVRRRIEPAEQPSSSWIPVSEKPLPESGRLLLQFANGGIETSLGSIHEEVMAEVVAWQPLPEPYVPPKPEQPKRREFYLSNVSGNWRVHACKISSQSIPVAEVLPGDVDPDAAIRAREFCEEHGTDVNGIDILRILNGGKQ